MGNFENPKAGPEGPRDITFPDRIVQFGDRFGGPRPFERELNLDLAGRVGVDSGRLVYSAIAQVRGVLDVKAPDRSELAIVERIAHNARRVAAGAFAFHQEVDVFSWEVDGHGADANPAVRAVRGASRAIVEVGYPNRLRVAAMLQNYNGPDVQDLYQEHTLRTMQFPLGASLGYSFADMMRAEVPRNIAVAQVPELTIVPPIVNQSRLQAA